MASFRRAGTERINAFPVDDSYLFKHYFESDELFARLQRYYEPYDYRFEVPADRFEGIRAILSDSDYALVPVEDPEPFAVVKRKYTDHPSSLFRHAVYQRSVDNFNCFVMKSRDAVERAVEAGATPIAEAAVTLPE